MSPLAVSPSCPLPLSAAQKSCPPQSSAPSSPPPSAGKSTQAAGLSSLKPAIRGGNQRRRLRLTQARRPPLTQAPLAAAHSSPMAAAHSSPEHGPVDPSLAQGGLPVPVGCPVLVLSPRGLLILPSCPMNFSWGGGGGRVASRVDRGPYPVFCVCPEGPPERPPVVL